MNTAEGILEAAAILLNAKCILILPMKEYTMLKEAVLTAKTQEVT